MRRGSSSGSAVPRGRAGAISGRGVTRLVVTMETMHAAGRRTLPPVPRAAAGTVMSAPARQTCSVQEPAAPVDRTTRTPAARTPRDTAAAPVDAGQAFVARLRARGAVFAQAAGAESAVVREVVPPARHRRSRCRVVLRSADGTETDLTFVGERRRTGSSTEEIFDAGITHWLAGGRLHDPAWLVPDPEAADGVAVDVTAWLATG